MACGVRLELKPLCLAMMETFKNGLNGLRGPSGIETLRTQDASKERNGV